MARAVEVSEVLEQQTLAAVVAVVVHPPVLLAEPEALVLLLSVTR